MKIEGGYCKRMQAARVHYSKVSEPMLWSGDGKNLVGFIFLQFLLLPIANRGCKPAKGGNKVLRIAPIVSFFTLFPQKSHKAVKTPYNDKIQ